MARDKLKLVRVHTQDQALNRVQENVARPLDELHRSPVGEMADGSKVTWTFTAGTNNLPHKLGRAYIGYLCVRCDQQTVFAEYEASTVDRTKYLPLQASDACTATFYIW